MPQEISEGSALLVVSERLRSIARNVLNNVLSIERGQVAVFYAGVENLDIAYAFAAECESDHCLCYCIHLGRGGHDATVAPNRSRSLCRDCSIGVV